MLNHHAPEPDILNVLSSLSSDEVFTPPALANTMLDLLPQELFRNPNAKFLDPACKSGVFLREIAQRLIKGLEQDIPDLQERLNHIFTEQLFGIATTKLAALISRRTLYCSKTADGPSSIVSDGFKGNPNGNIQSPGTEADRLDGMKFDVIITNQLCQRDNGEAWSWETAKSLMPQHIVMLVPAGWCADDMLSDTHIKERQDYPCASDCLPGVEIKGGICILHWDSSYNRE